MVVDDQQILVVAVAVAVVDGVAAAVADVDFVVVDAVDDFVADSGCIDFPIVVVSVVGFGFGFALCSGYYTGLLWAATTTACCHSSVAAD